MNACRAASLVATLAFALPLGAQTCQTVIIYPTLEQSFNGLVRDLASFDDGAGNGEQVYVAGQFSTCGGVAVGCVARLGASGRYEAVGTGGLSGSARAVSGFIDASGSRRLMVAGGFSSGNIAAWDGTQWTISTAPFPGSVFTLKAFDLGDGPRLFAGLFGGGVWSFDGTAWTRLGPPGQASSMSRCQALAAFDDDGDGPNPKRLYVAGSFNLGAGISGLARFDGMQWVGVPGAPNFGWAKSLETFDDGAGGGMALYVGSHPVGPPMTANACISRWNGTAWSFPIGPNGATGFDPAYSLVVADLGEGSGPRMFSYTTMGVIRSTIDPRWSLVATNPTCPASTVDYRSTGLAYRAPDSQTPMVFLPSGSHMSLVRITGCPRCAADADLDGRATVGDIFTYLSRWFALNAAADFDGSGQVTVEDLFQFLGAWFAGC